MTSLDSKRIVIKLGTGILTQGVGTLDTERIHGLCREIAALHERNHEIIIVSSGAVGLGMGRLGLTRRPSRLATLQMCAAVGQSMLIETWQQGFLPHNRIVAQILLTREDVRARNRHLAIRDLIEETLAKGIIPIINENDSVSTAEIKFGDNDILSAMVASLAKAQLLVILSTAPGLIDMKGSGQIVPLVETITADIEAMAGGTTSATAVGGMITKIEAARLANRSGVGVFLGSGSRPEILSELAQGRAKGTFFVPGRATLASRKRWLAFFQQPKGTVTIDEGAVEALKQRGGSLLAKGIQSCHGSFAAGEVIGLQDSGGKSIGRGISQFSSKEINQIAGHGRDQLKQAFPNRRRHEVIHRDTLVIF